MLLGKRPRPPIMKRTTSMSGGMAVDTQTTNDELISDSLNPQNDVALSDQTINVFEVKGSYQRFMAMPPSPTTTNYHRHTHTHNHTNTNIHTPHFLRTCGLCNSALPPGRDIYMYRGDTAFCSLECREKQMKQDQRKEKWKAGSSKERHRESPPGATANASTKSETAACN
ncbi:hypothetical protein CR513_54547, partial [Mucuna pruriens]